MQTVGSDEAMTNLPDLLQLVARGEEITITQNGVPVARLIPAEPAAKREVRAVIEEIRKFRKGHKLAGLTIGEMIREGRRF